jgi:AraC family ethanolamine operon transcriptional activator
VLLRERFNSFDEYAASLGHADLRVLALKRERQRWESCQIDLDGVRIRRARDGGACVFDGAIDADVVGLMVCVDVTGKMIGNGTAFGPGSVMVVPRCRQIRVVSLDAVEWISALIPTSRLARTVNDERALPGLTCGVVDPPTAGVVAFRRTLLHVARAAMTGGYDGNHRIGREASHKLVAAARSLLKAPPEATVSPRPGRPRMPRFEMIQLVERWLEEEADSRPALCDLAHAAGVSHRTLHAACAEQLGVSPKRFLRVLQLNAVRRELMCRNDPDVRVTDVLSRLGVWEWGRFSGEYGALFGELPSETIRRQVGRR